MFDNPYGEPDAELRAGDKAIAPGNGIFKGSSRSGSRPASENR